MSESAIIRIRKETREKLHSLKYPGQTLDGFITQMIDLWEKAKEAEKEKVLVK